jgi:hypothetical protein
LLPPAPEQVLLFARFPSLGNACGAASRSGIADQTWFGRPNPLPNPLCIFYLTGGTVVYTFASNVEKIVNSLDSLSARFGPRAEPDTTLQRSAAVDCRTHLHDLT